MSSVMNVRLNEKMTLKFVELYRDQRLLWDKEHEAYNKRADRLRAYRRIADGMAVDGLGVPEVATKIKNIRSTYLQELKKIKDSVQRPKSEEDQDEDVTYVPKLLWFPILDSMIGGAAVKRLYSSSSFAEVISVDYTEEENSNAYLFYADNGSGDEGTSTAIKREPSVTDCPPAKRLQYEQQQSSSELFSKYISTSLDMLPPQLAIMAQKEMHDVLVKYKLIEYDQDQGHL